VRTVRSSIATVLFALLTCLAAAHAQTLTLRQMDHTAWTARDGAPIGVNDIAQAPDGTLWLATRGGLYHFDGLHFTTFQPPPGEPSLPSIEMRSVYIARDHALWVMPWLKDLIRIKDGHVRIYGQQDGLPSGMVGGMLQAPDDSIWVLLRGIIYRQSGERWVEALPVKLPTDVTNFHFDSAGVLWIATRTFIYFVPKGSSLPQQTQVRGGGVLDFIEMKDGSLWINAQPPESSVHRISVPGHINNRPLSYSVEASTATLDPGGNLWIATNRAGIQRIAAEALTAQRTGIIKRDDPTVQSYDQAAGLSGISAFAILHDENGTIWAGTTRGLDRFHIPTLTKLPDASVEGDVGVTACPNGTVWLGSGDFLVTVDGDKIAHHHKGEIWGLYCDRKGTLWFNKAGEIVQVKDGVEHSIPAPPVDVSYCVTQLVGDAENLYAPCSRSGLWLHTSAGWSKIERDGFPREAPVSIAQDAAGRIWTGYMDNKVGMLDGSQAKTYSIDTAPGLGNVQAVLATQRAVLAGGAHGLAALQGESFRSLLTVDPDAVQGISGIVEDHNGDLWLNGARGVFRIQAAELTKALAANGYRMQSQHFTGDGLVGFPYQTYELPSAVIAPNGRIWIATSSTAVYVDPDKIKPATVAPTTTILGFSDNETDRFDPNPKVAPGKHTLRIRYFGAYLNAPERVVYRYRLEGQDQAWQEVGARIEAVYTNLRPGQYTFHVAASNGEGVWSEAASPLQFQVMPAFYQRWWFLAACLIAFLLLLRLAFRMRFDYATAQLKRRLEERAQERVRIARDLHDTLLQGIQGLILCFHSDIEDVPEDLPARAMLEKTLTRAEGVIAEGRERVRTLRSEESTATDLPEALAQVSSSLGLNDSTAIEFLVEGEPRPLRTIVHDEVYSIGREAISNALHHARSTRIEVEITYGPTNLRLRCRDNGRGMSRERLEAGSPTGHWGITGMKERASRIGATLNIWSTPGAGTEVEVNVPASTAYFIDRSRRQNKP
jgi:signal transduction histidine kinase/ligand-binding sensor domain-containing protein